MNRLIPRLAICAALALTLALPLHSASADPPLPTVQQITQKLDDMYRSRSSHAQMTMKIVTRRFSRTLEVESWSLGEDLSLMVIRKPARESGTATLRTEEGLWNFAPRADRLMRIPSGMLSESWMGSHFTNDDLMRESSWEKDFTTTIGWMDDSGTRRLQLTAVPKPDAAVVYSKVVFVVDAESWLPLRAEYYDDDEVVRTTHFRDVREFSGRKMPSLMLVVPADKPDESTEVRWDSMTFDGAIQRSLFTPRGLRRAAQRR